MNPQQKTSGIATVNTTMTLMTDESHHETQVLPASPQRRSGMELIPEHTNAGTMKKNTTFAKERKW
ncbi:hypothetical protein O9929_16055 [Vibrio lentus]|nr:hypothetical protein [Vibrio lentus]